MILCSMVPVKSTFYITAEMNLNIFRNIVGGAGRCTEPFSLLFASQPFSLSHSLPCVFFSLSLAVPPYQLLLDDLRPLISSPSPFDS